ncbi:pyridoxamine 5'-phosphate oxidase family protein [Clavibacter sp. MX14-G9D]|uniref:pyridoxamine 5'-phosphate oxidase family protein n=1 Tax=Clavibacter sp. MX14-G9D TaxID=3064656 RepID=UPI00293E821B|nr:pyridoxamine 5'-phosphate oxidase family protein [Clavibacter sp. MX14-G9D]
MTDIQDDQADRERVAELIKGARIALLTTVNAHGQLVSRPLASQERDFDGDLWFFTKDPSDKTTEIRANDQVNVSLQTGDGFLSIAGTAEVTRDRGRIDELWSAGAEAWFEGGKEDPSVALVRVHADAAEYWYQDTPKPVALIKYAKAVVTGERPKDVGEHGTVEL